jgi:hypothetical protein
VIVPTRSRPQNILPIVEAWWATGAFDVADLWFSYDFDDGQRIRYKRTLERMAEVKAISNPEWMPLVPKLNRGAVSLARFHEYPFVAFMGDDHIPLTPRWAHMLVENHMTSGKKIWYGQDGYQNEKLPTWWSMDSRIIKTLDRMVPAPVQHLFCDNAVLVLGQAAQTIGYDERILIEHRHPLLGKAKSDQQYERVNRPEQYQRDGDAFNAWLRNGLARDATLVRNVGG